MADLAAALRPPTSNYDVTMPKERATVYFERGRQLSLITSGSSIETERILVYLYKALTFDNEHIPTYMLLGKTYRVNLDLTSAMFCFRLVLRIEPTNQTAKKSLSELLILKGKELMMLGAELNWKMKFIHARACFDEALDFFRDSDELYILKAVCHVYVEEWVEAYEAASKVIKPGRSLPAEVYILRAKINWGRGLVEQGNQDIRNAASIDPDHPEVQGFVARSYAKSERLYKKALSAFAGQRLKEALEHVDHALYITNDDVKLYLMKAKIFRMQGEYQAAYEAVLKAKELFSVAFHHHHDGNGSDDMFPTFALPHELQHQLNLILNDLALEYAGKGDYSNAILLLNKILRDETSPLDHHSHSNHSSHSVSVKPLANPVTLLRVDYKYFVNRGDCYRAINRLQEAILDYQSALSLQSDDNHIKSRLSLAYYLVAIEHFNAAKYLEAEIGLSKAINCNKAVGEYYALRGKARFYLGMFFEAYSDYRRAMKLDPNNADIQQRLKQFENNAEVKKQKKRLKQRQQLFSAGNNHNHPSNDNNNNANNKGMDDNMSSTSTISTAAMLSPPNKTKPAKAEPVDYEQQSTYVNEQSILRLRANEDDQIAMMLHPKHARSLPNPKLLTTDDKQLSLQQPSSSSSAGQAATAVPPTMTRPPAAFRRAFAAAEIVAAKQERVKQVMEEKNDFSRDGGLWRLLEGTGPEKRKKKQKRVSEKARK